MNPQSSRHTLTRIFTSVRRSKFQRILDRIRENPIEFDQGRYERLLEKINAREDHLKGTENRTLQMLSRELAGRARSGSSLDELLVEAFALVREVAHRSVGLRPF